MTNYSVEKPCGQEHMGLEVRYSQLCFGNTKTSDPPHAIAFVGGFFHPLTGGFKKIK